MKLEPADKFNGSCQQQAETNNPILGCYSAQRIFVFDVTNQKLNGIEETTAAHEVLHAAYERLKASERAELDIELRRVYELNKTPELEERMAYYQKTEPGEENNELHSILGSEIANVGEVLEQHFGRYFTNRANLLNYYNSYSSVFKSVSTQLKTLEQSINQSSNSVNARVESYNRSAQQLQVDADEFEAANQRGDFASASEFNRARAQLVIKQNQLESERESINSEIARINQLRDQYNALVADYNDLNTSINSSLVPAAPAIQ